MNKVDKKDSGRWLYITGSTLTVIYLAFFIWYCSNRWGEILQMQPNNLGDFLAGSFSPLAFAWLVLGFIQQGIELRQNSAALLLQAEELRSAATHAAAMVELQRKEFDLRIQELEDARKKAEESRLATAKRAEEAAVRRMQPKFSFGIASRELKQQHIAESSLTNYGAACTNVRIWMESIAGVLELGGTTDFAVFPSQLRHPILFVSRNAEPRTQPLTVNYTDASGAERCQTFIVSIDGSHLVIEGVNA